MKRLLLSAFACDPTKGSEPGYGWNWAIGLVREGYEVHCITRLISKDSIESKSLPANLHFHYIKLPLGLEKLYTASQATMYLYYILWQWRAYKKGVDLNKDYKFDVVHHITWGSLQLGSFLYKLDVPFIFGPAGGGQVAPPAFKEYFKRHWAAEEKRERVSKLMLKYNPGCKNMFGKAYSILVANADTFEMAKVNGAKNLSHELDVSIPDSFFPEKRTIKSLREGKLKLLWVGRFLPRKGVLLLLDVMNELKDYPFITLSVVGDGEMREDFLQRIAELGLSSTVHWVGKVPYNTVRDYYASHDVFFYTSLRDSGSSQLVEAMAFGLPIVTLNLHGQALIVDDSTGIRVPCNAPEEAIPMLREAILRLYNTPGLVESMSMAAYDFADSQKWERKINKIVNQYYPQK